MSTEESTTSAPSHAPPEKVTPHELPRPTVFPATMAFGVTFLLWGSVTSPVILAAGIIVAAAGLVGWIGEIRHEP